MNGKKHNVSWPVTTKRNIFNILIYIYTLSCRYVGQGRHCDGETELVLQLQHQSDATGTAATEQMWHTSVVECVTQRLVFLEQIYPLFKSGIMKLNGSFRLQNVFFTKMFNQHIFRPSILVPIQ